MRTGAQARTIGFTVLLLVLWTFAVESQSRSDAAEKLMSEATMLERQQTADASRAALEKFNSALATWRDLGDAQHQIDTLKHIGKIQTQLGDLSKAVTTFDDALRLAAAGKDQASEADLRLELSDVYSQLGDARRGIDEANKALAVARELKDQKLTAISLVSLGVYFDRLGEKQHALDRYSEALPIVRAMNDKEGESSTLINIGAVYASLGKFDRAIEYFQQSLPIIKDLHDERREATMLNNIGASYDQLEDNQKALDNYLAALALRQKLGDRLGVSITLTNAAGVYEKLGNRPKAHDLYEQALSIQREVHARNREATTLSNLGRLYFGEHDLDKALSYFNASLVIRHEVGDIFGEAKTLSNLAAAERERGNFEASLDWISRSLAIFESVRASLASPDLRAAYFSSVQDYYRFEIDLLMTMQAKDPGKGYESLAFQASERSRVQGLLDMLSAAKLDLQRSVPESLRQRESELQKQLNAKDKERRTATADKAVAIEKDIHDIEEAYEAVEADIRKTSPAYADLARPRTITVPDVQKMLDADTVFLEFSLGSSSSYLWAIDSTGIKSYKLPPRAEIEAVARGLYESVKDPAQQAQAREAEVALGRLLLGPAIRDLASKRLAISTDGILGFVPFAALIAENDQPLIAGHEIVYLPSAMTLAALRSVKSPKAPQNSVAVFADPVFSAEDTRVGAKAVNNTATSDPDLLSATRDAGLKGSLPRLPATRREANAILALVPASERKRALDFDASLPAVTGSDLKNFSIVHFATHGILDSGHPEFSGIVLSLVDKNGKEQEGYLRLNAIYGLDLPVDLVVLSACQTALGKDVRGEGLIGLTRGFMFAGAKRVVASQWSVNDESTSELMKLFYQKMLSGDRQNPIAALRSAQLELLRSKRFSSPYYWAAFAAQGDWK